MPEAITNYKLFLASPGDVANERDIVKKVISEFNAQYVRELKSTITIITWENSTHPAFGSYPQNVINQQIGEYDIFVGILWSKFGTPTPSYGSGTEEEFNIAYDKFKSNPNEIQIMIYFNQDGVPINDIELEQIAKLKSFKNKLGLLGGYYFDFSSNNFEELFRKHIYDVITKWNTPRIVESPLPIELMVNNEIDSEIDEKEELGWLDYQDIISNKFVESTSYINMINDELSKFSFEITGKTAELNLANQNQYGNNIKKQIVSQSAKIINRLYISLEMPMLNWYRLFFDGIKALKEIILLTEEIGNLTTIELEDSKTQLEYIHSAIESSLKPSTEFLQSIKDLPKISQQIIIAKKNLASRINSFIMDMQSSLIDIEELIQYIETKIEIIKSSQKITE
ncbi:MAG TPA: DUF4062 domain-containing protein [Paludibacter sp.]